MYAIGRLGSQSARRILDATRNYFFSCLVFRCFNAKHCSIQQRCDTAAGVLSFECLTARQYDQYQYKSSLLKFPAMSNLQWVDSLSCPNLKTFRQSLRSVSLAQQAQSAGFFATTYVSLSSVHCHLDSNRLH